MVTAAAAGLLSKPWKPWHCDQGCDKTTANQASCGSAYDIKFPER